VLATAQDAVKGEEWGQGHRVSTNGPEYLQEGYLAGLVVDAGWAADAVETTSLAISLTEGEDWDGLYNFLINSPIKMAATRDWSEEELEKWPEAMQASFQKEKQSFGGVRFEAWVVIARKK